MTDATSKFFDYLFPRRMVFVRSTNTQELRMHTGDSDQKYYTVVDITGDALLIVCGNSSFAFAAAWNAKFFPTWMH